jgi:hypothetical protein
LAPFGDEMCIGLIGHQIRINKFSNSGSDVLACRGGQFVHFPQNTTHTVLILPRSSFAGSISIPMMWLPVAIFFTISWLTWARRSCHTLSVAEIVLVTGLVTGSFWPRCQVYTEFSPFAILPSRCHLLHDLGLILGDNDYISTFRDATDWHQVHCQLRDA